MKPRMSKQQKAARKTAAEGRQAIYNALTVQQKLAQIDVRPGNSSKERARLEGSDE